MFRLILLLILLLPACAIVVALKGTQTSPLVAGTVSLTNADIERAKLLLREHNPRKMQSGEVKTVTMTSKDLNLVANHLINRASSGGALFVLSENAMDIAATLSLDGIAPGRYVNLEAALSSSNGNADIQALKVGDISVPRALVSAVAAFIIEHLYRAAGVTDARKTIRSVSMTPRALDVTYQWHDTVANAVRDRFVSNASRESLRAYHDELTRLVAADERIGFPGLLRAMFQHAERRAASSDPTAENRAAILVLNAYVSGRGLAVLAPESQSWPKPKRVSLKLHGRSDFVKHFATSAALAATGGQEVADAIGLIKEIDDADGGSGFSFRDLVADKAGTAFGRKITLSERDAQAVYARLRDPLTDNALMPSGKAYEENMTDAQFKARYGGVGSARYNAVVDQVDKEISDLELYP